MAFIGINEGTVATPATTGSISLVISAGIITLTPTGACTLNTSTTALIGTQITFVITTSGTTSFVITFGTNFKSVGTLATGTVSGKKFCVTFQCLDGTTWIEIARTIAM